MTSSAPDLTEALPAPISLSTGASSAYPANAGWDVTIGSIGFRTRISPQTPYLRQTDSTQKQQIDTSDEAGEQSLSGWWMRSQVSWHLGQGITWYEPGSDNDTEYRYATARGIDPWSTGEVKLLHKTSAVGSAMSGTVHLSTMRVSGTDGHLAVGGDTYVWSPDGGSEVTGTLGGSSATQPTTFGSKAWIGHDAGVDLYDAATNTLTSPLTSASQCRAWWVKSRLIVAVGPILYELTAADTGAISTVGTAIYTHPDADWVWTDVDEAGEAIIAGGYADATSAIYRFSIVADSSNQPVLSGASQVAQLKYGEQLLSMRIYLGAYLVLGTNLGVRIGSVSSAGAVQYGPLTIETSQPVVNMTFRDRFVYVISTGCQPDDTTGAARIDLSSPIGDTGRYAYAWDVTSGAYGTASSICFVGQTDRVVLAVDSQRYVQSATEYVSSGVMETGRIRFGTVEQKAFRLARLLSSLNGGQVKLTAIDQSETEHRIYTYSDQANTTSDVGISITNREVNPYLAFRITLTPPTAGTATPTVSGFSVKAVPAPTRMRLVQIPVSLFDFEVTRSGQRVGKAGGAMLRLLALEELEDAAVPVTVRDLTADYAFVGLIESTSFSSASPPDRGQSGFGGTALVTLRKL